ncbi:MAG: hypothetical protein PHX82_16535 [Paracoccaceae bacterium]|jgi:hypothetical protein|nr:hypothetical protein [Paracoccaceae bacterium]
MQNSQQMGAQQGTQSPAPAKPQQQQGQTTPAPQQIGFTDWASI